MDDLFGTVSAALGRKQDEASTMRDMLNADQLPPPAYKMNWQGQPMEAGTGNIQNNPSGFDSSIVLNAVKNASLQPEQMGNKVPLPKPLTEADKRNIVDVQETGLGEGALHVVSNIGANIIGGLHGLATLVTGGGMEKAANNVNADIQNRTYQPTTEGGKNVTEALESPYNPMNWVPIGGRKAGELTLKTLNSPAAAAGVETGINAIPLVFGFKMGGKDINLPQPMTAKSVGVDRPMDIQNNINSPEKVPAQQTTSNQAPPELKITPPENYVGNPLPLDKQNARVQTLQRIGISDVRKSAIEGDQAAASSDYQTSKLDNPSGTLLKSTINQEKQALQNHAEQIVHDTGSTIGTDQSTLYNRGNIILAPLDNLKSYFDQKTNELYKEADSRAGNVPIEMPKTQEYIGGDKADFTGSVEGEALLKGINARMKSLGMMDEQGTPQAVTVQQAEQLKQYLNNQWQPRTARLIRKMKDSIDDDVLSSAGEDIYQQARAMRAIRAKTIDDPNGIAKIMDSSGPDGVNRSVPVEKVADTLAGMPVDQLNHIVNTLKNVPEELKPQAQEAINEIKGHFANKVYEIGSKNQGQWNSKGVNNYLKNNKEKINQLFTPEEISKFQDLHDAGNILNIDTSYPGAAVQSNNLVQRGVLTGLRAGGAATGGFFGGPVGAAAGDIAGAAVGKKIADKAALKSTQKRVVKLSDLPK